MVSGSEEDDNQRKNISAELIQMFAKRDDHDEAFEPHEIFETLLLASNTTSEDLDSPRADDETLDAMLSRAQDGYFNPSSSSISEKCDHCLVENVNSSMSFSSAPPDCAGSSRNICPTDDNYPSFMVKSVIEKHGETLSAILDTLRHDVDPADIFVSESDLEVNSEVAVCDTTVENIRPGWAKDAQTDQWMVIVNLDRYLQIVRVESCIRENSTCLFISPYYKSLCLEHFSVHRLVAIDPRFPERGPVVGVFKMPCGCSCKVEMVREQ